MSFGIQISTAGQGLKLLDNQVGGQYAYLLRRNATGSEPI